MRKTNNRGGVCSDPMDEEEHFLVVYDQDTNEFLTSLGSEPGESEWSVLPGLESDDPSEALDQIAYSARFDALVAAQDVADSLAQEISDDHPHDQVNLQIVRLEVRRTLVVDILTEPYGAYVSPDEGDEDPHILDGPDDEYDECCINEVCDDSCADAPDHDDVLEGRANKPKKSKKRKR